MNRVSLRAKYLGDEPTLRGHTGWAHRPASDLHETPWTFEADDGARPVQRAGRDGVAWWERGRERGVRRRPWREDRSFGAVGSAEHGRRGAPVDTRASNTRLSTSSRDGRGARVRGEGAEVGDGRHRPT
jgi:hypothetical protein